MFNISEIIDLAIQIEKNGEKIYRNALRMVSNPSISKMLQRLADEEIQHIEWFSTLKEKIKTNPEDPQLEEMKRSILASVLGDQSFSLKDVDFSGVKSVTDLLRSAIEFERDTILFYEMIRPLMGDDEAMKELDRIINEENQHIQLFQEILDAGGLLIKKPDEGH